MRLILEDYKTDHTAKELFDTNHHQQLKFSGDGEMLRLPVEHGTEIWNAYRGPLFASLSWPPGDQVQESDCTSLSSLVLFLSLQQPTSFFSLHRAAHSSNVEADSVASASHA